MRRNQAQATWSDEPHRKRERKQTYKDRAAYYETTHCDVCPLNGVPLERLGPVMTANRRKLGNRTDSNHKSMGNDQFQYGKKHEIGVKREWTEINRIDIKWNLKLKYSVDLMVKYSVDSPLKIWYNLYAITRQ